MHTPNTFNVSCKGGTEYIGDVCVGAIGISSKVRDEIHKSANKAGLKGLVAKDNLTSQSRPESPFKFQIVLLLFYCNS